MHQIVPQATKQGPLALLCINVSTVPGRNCPGLRDFAGFLDSMTKQMRIPTEAFPEREHLRFFLLLHQHVWSRQTTADRWWTLQHSKPAPPSHGNSPLPSTEVQSSCQGKTKSKVYAICPEFKISIIIMWKAFIALCRCSV